MESICPAIRRCLIASAIPAASGCTVYLVPDDDETSVAELPQINTDVTVFVNRMIDSAGTPAGEYVENKEFYWSFISPTTARSPGRSFALKRAGAQ